MFQNSSASTSQRAQQLQSERVASLLSPAASQLLEDCRCTCENLPQQLTSLCTFRHFLFVLCAELRKAQQPDSNPLWAWMAGRCVHLRVHVSHVELKTLNLKCLVSLFRIYLVFSRNFMQQLSASGIANFTHLFVSLALAVDHLALVESRSRIIMSSFANSSDFRFRRARWSSSWLSFRVAS